MPVAPVQLPAAVFNVVEPTVPVPAPEPTVEPQQPVAVIQEQQQLFVVQVVFVFHGTCIISCEYFTFYSTNLGNIF